MKALFFSLFLFTSTSFIQSQKLSVVNIEELRSLSGSWDYCKIDVKLDSQSTLVGSSGI